MTRKTLIITDADRHQLEALLDSEFAKVVRPSQLCDDLRAELNRAHIVSGDEVPEDVVTMNSTVTLRDLESGETETYTLVHPSDADIANNKLSVLAPIGTAVLGQRVGDKLRWPVPAGWRRLKVERVVYQPEREGIYSVAGPLHGTGYL